MNEHGQHHQIEEIGPAIRVVVIPGTPWHEAIGSEVNAEIAATVNRKPWPYECPEGEDCECAEQTASGICPQCGHYTCHTSAETEHVYIDYSLAEEIFLACGEPVSAGETCKCPCHGTR